jgi:hypothetical protein
MAGWKSCTAKRAAPLNPFNCVPVALAAPDLDRLDADIRESRYFRGPEGRLNLRAKNLALFLQIAEGIDDSTWLHHLRAGGG